MSLLSLCLNAVIEGDVFVSSGNLFQAGILTFISMINTLSERLKARSFFICRYFSFYEQLKVHAQLS